MYENLYFSVDATETTGLCKYINDSPVPNCVMKKISVEHRPYLCLFALKDIDIGEELRYNYGDASKNLWWRKNVCYIFKNKIMPLL